MTSTCFKSRTPRQKEIINHSSKPTKPLFIVWPNWANHCFLLKFFRGNVYAGGHVPKDILLFDASCFLSWFQIRTSNLSKSKQGRPGIIWGSKSEVKFNIGSIWTLYQNILAHLIPFGAFVRIIRKYNITVTPVKNFI